MKQDDNYTFKNGPTWVCLLVAPVHHAGTVKLRSIFLQSLALPPKPNTLIILFQE